MIATKKSMAKPIPITHGVAADGTTFAVITIAAST
jgi:hypothetical protein